MITEYSLFESKGSGRGKKVIAYHFSNQLRHMEESDFRMEYIAKGGSIFGQAFYFSSSPNIDYKPMNEGKKTYCCKFEINLKEPVLDMNALLVKGTVPKNVVQIERSSEDIIKQFNGVYGTKFRPIKVYLIGEVFLYLWGENEDAEENFRDFITQHLGYNSFKYYQDHFTNFRSKLGDYGTSYGIYDPKDIKFIDGPF